MNKILVDIYIPSMNKSFDVYLPLTNKIYEIEKLLAEAFKDLSDGYFTTNDPVLCDRETGTILDINKSAWELELKNGSKLMLI